VLASVATRVAFLDPARRSIGVHGPLAISARSSRTAAVLTRLQPPAHLDARRLRRGRERHQQGGVAAS